MSVKARVYPEASSDDGSYRPLHGEVYTLELPAPPREGDKWHIGMISKEYYDLEYDFVVTEVELTWMQYSEAPEFGVYWVSIRTESPYGEVEELDFPACWEA